MIIHARNPRNGTIDYSFKSPTSEELYATCMYLRDNQINWSRLSINERINALQKWKNAVEKNKQQLIEALVVDTGRLWETNLEVDLVATSIDRWCSIASNLFQYKPDRVTSIPTLSLENNWVPYTLVGVISPWNFPLLLSLIDTIPALLAGCAVVVKPSEITPRFIEVIQKTIQEVPELKNVLSYIQGNGETGEALLNLCDLVCFTGSTETGKKVYQIAAKKMIPVFLEMGGKDPAIILEGADLEGAAAAICWGATANAGQSCLSIERIYVQETIFDNFSTILTKKVATMELNYPLIEKGKVGPIIFKKQAEIINDHLVDAIQKGALILTGSESCIELGGGLYCKPTVLKNVNHSMKIMREETFGPIMPLMPFKTIDEAINLANDTQYGLSGAVFARTNEEAVEVAKNIHAGAISINDAALTAVMHEGEKSAFRLSGIGGSRMGPSAIQRFLKTQVFIKKNGDSSSPWW